MWSSESPCDPTHRFSFDTKASAARSAFARGTRFGQQGIRRFAQSEAREPLTELRKLDRELGLIPFGGLLLGRWVGGVKQVPWRRCIVQGFARHPGQVPRLSPFLTAGGHLPLQGWRRKFDRLAWSGSGRLSGQGTCCKCGTWRVHGSQDRLGPRFRGVAGEQHRTRPDCHNLHGVKCRGISASKLWRCSTDLSFSGSRTIRPSCCDVSH